MKALLIAALIAHPTAYKPTTIYDKARVAPVTSVWQGPLNTYTGGSYGVGTVNNLWHKAPRGKRRGIVLQMAAKHRIPARLLLGVWGIESGFGRYACHFGLVGYFPGRGTSGNFTRDADLAGGIFQRLYRSRYGKDAIR
ncbi:hypothetical protein EBZ39_16430 [bacterium]|nr:hypothetical protein [bacterium]